MIDEPTREQLNRELTQTPEERIISPEEPVPSNDDPGGAHAKGYSADPRDEGDVKEDGPIPLADVPEDAPPIRQPEREGKVRPTGRSEHHDYTPNDRLMGSDR